MPPLNHTEIDKMAAKIHALQHGYTSARNEREIAKIILSVDGIDLTHLKNTIDRGGDHCDLLELVYSDIDNREIRAEILHHLKTRSAHFSRVPVRILSDVDDTLYASLHDKRYPTASLYPGVVALHEEIQSSAQWEDSPVAALVLLTARPRDKMGIVERWTQRQMLKKGLPEMTVLSGTLFDLRSHQAMADRKLVNFQMYQELYPEYEFLFFGDSGQGDALLGKMMMEQFAQRITAILIHQVNDRVLEDGLTTFETYLGAAIALRDRGLLERAACERIYKASLTHIEKIKFNTEEQKQRALESLARDHSRL